MAAARSHASSAKLARFAVSALDQRGELMIRECGPLTLARRNRSTRKFGWWFSARSGPPPPYFAHFDTAKP